MGSSNVPWDSWMYPGIERLIALGYIKSGYLGIRPWTRLECARMIEEAKQQIEDAGDQGGEAVRAYNDLAGGTSVRTCRLAGAGKFCAGAAFLSAPPAHTFATPPRGRH